MNTSTIYKKFLMAMSCLACMFAFSLPVLATPPEKIIIEVARTAEVISPLIYLGEIA
ncbi:MAG TPA: flagella basal body P-ring formation protein FlgA, partial [Desulfobacter sp.]|nr:flagella basal body P-ring formation protein FlgA [Desulfobacter sp.]